MLANQFSAMDKKQSNPDASASTEDRRLQIARAIAAKTFHSQKRQRSHENIAHETNNKRGGGAGGVRGVGTNEIIRNSKYQDLYSMEMEREFMTSYHFKTIIHEMQKMTRYSRVSTRSLVRTLRHGLKV